MISFAKQSPFAASTDLSTLKFTTESKMYDHLPSIEIRGSVSNATEMNADRFGEFIVRRAAAGIADRVTIGGNLNDEPHAEVDCGLVTVRV